MKTWQLIVRLMRLSPWRLGLAGASATAVFSLPVATGLVIRAFFDLLSGSAPAGFGLWEVLVLFLVVDAGLLISDAGLSFGWITFLNASMATLRHDLLHQVLRRHSASAALPESSGAVMSRFRDDAEEIVESIDAWIDIVGRTVFMAIALVVLFRINTALTLSVLLPVAASVTLVNLAGERVKRHRVAARQATGDVTGFLGEMFGAVQAIAVAGATPRVVQRLRRLSDVRRQAALNDRVFGELLGAFYANAAHIATGLLLLLAAREMRAGTFTVGDFALFVAYLPQVSTFGDEIARWITGYRRAGVSVGRLAALVPGERAAPLVAAGAPYLAHPPAPPQAPERRDEHRLESVEVRRLVARHPGSRWGLGPVDLTLRRGTLTVLTGRIGSGKSTLLEALLGLRPLEGGEVRWNGKVVDPTSGALAPSRAAYVPQVPRLVSDTLRDNILQGLPAERAGLDSALHLAVLDRDVRTLECGLDTVVGPRGVRLSGGQVQRAATARALVRHPELLVVDDLSSALDVETEAALWERLATADGNRTILAVSHRRVALRRADQVIVMEHGRIEACGTLQEVLASSPHIQRIWTGET
ncbi:MAG: Heterodimeric efflux ABC transporter, permease/ATP-binding subunit 2 [uncultured Chloroflexi bacterium]|uniref:Heterodimeric efflux ABC transporter, permease/ATP-binding subunit 2 n=1 Tax=uncultured Chloroflexota bacterium TaxID=166587 RepID=A0A6J4ICS6_9CHLR|nr:MAG: Heterodimeric efflux ABC transporter, permease/ATP-binding subunit 2 [uncultured Chloroflexota bacterium]